MENIKISVVIPVYNGEGFIEKAIQSVLCQTFQDFEIIVVDDHSNDKTVEIVKNFANKDERIKLILLNENSGGPAKPRNEGIKIAKGKYIAFLDQDDLYLPDSLEKRFKVLQEKNPDVLIANMWVVDINSGKFIDYVNSISSGLIIRKQCFDSNEIGYLNEDISGTDEYEWLIRYKIKKGTSKICYHDEPTIIYTRHENQLSKEEYSEKLITKFLKNDLAILKLLESNCNYNKEDLSWIYFWIGYRYGLLGDFKSSRQFLIKSLKTNFRFITLFFLIFSILNNKFMYIGLSRFLKIIKKCIKELRLRKMIKKYPENYKNAVEFYKNISQLKII